MTERCYVPDCPICQAPDSEGRRNAQALRDEARRDLPGERQRAAIRAAITITNPRSEK